MAQSRSTTFTDRTAGRRGEQNHSSANATNTFATAANAITRKLPNEGIRKNPVTTALSTAPRVLTAYAVPVDSPGRRLSFDMLVSNAITAGKLKPNTAAAGKRANPATRNWPTSKPLKLSLAILKMGGRRLGN